MFIGSFYFWILISFLSFILEMARPGLFFFLSLSANSLIVALAWALGLSLSSQLLIMLVGTSSFYLFFKMKFKNHRNFVQEIDSYSLSKKCGAITFADGDIVQAQIDGHIWNVRPAERLKVGDNVQVTEVTEHKITVQRIQK